MVRFCGMFLRKLRDILEGGGWSAGVYPKHCDGRVGRILEVKRVHWISTGSVGQRST